MAKPRDCKIVETRFGEPGMTSRNQPIWKLDIKIEERPTIWISGVVYSDPKGWVGQTKSLILYTEDHQGTPLPKFKMAPPKSGVMLTNEKLDELISLMREVRDLLRRD